MEEEDIEFEHFQDCFNIASNLQSEHKYEEALEVIKDSGLDLNVHYQLEEIKINCLMNLGQIQQALKCLENSCIQVVLELINNFRYKDALHQIAKSKLDPKSHPKLLELQEFCLWTLEEMPLVKELIKQVYKSYSVKDYEKALALIDTCRFNHKVHLNLLETKVYCLKKLGRVEEAFNGAHYLWRNGYKMSRKLCQIIGDYFKENEGNEVAYNFYQGISNVDGISNDDQQYYLKLMKEINPNKQLMEDIIGDEPLHEKQPEMLNAPSNPKSKGKKKSKKKTKGSRGRSKLPEKSRNDNASEEVSQITSDEKDEKVHDEVKIKDDVRDSIFELEPQEEDVYVGHKKIDMGFDIPVTLIKCTELQLQNVNMLLSLDHINVLKIEDITNVNIGGASSTFFVVKSVQRVDHYYASLLKKFRSEYIVDDDDKEKVLCRWWKFIGLQFKTIFRELVDGLIFLILKGHVCSHDSFVTPDGTGKILPSMDRGYEVGDIVDNLVKQMKTIVYLPFLEHGLGLEPRWLPNDLLHLFIFLSKEKLKHVPVWWLLNHHFFWKSEEVVDFIYNLRDLHRKRKLGSWFTAYLNVEMHKGYDKFWSDYIPEGIYKEIWRKGDLNMKKPDESTEVDESKTLVWYKVAPYLHYVDIIRYMCDVYYHYNCCG